MSKSLYKLSYELVGHTADVRALAAGDDGNIISTSRDKTSILWKFEEGNCVGKVVMSGHTNFVSSVCVISPSEKYPKGLIVTGSNDSHILIFNSGETDPLYKYRAHENTVSSLTTSNLDKDSFLSSSWDISTKLWNINNLNKPEVVYLGHSLAVWSSCDLSSGFVVTAGADKSVIVFSRDGKILHKLQEHIDCVRGLVPINDVEFLSCSNDAIIKHWNAATGDCLGNFYGHSNYIYSISAVNGGNLVVSSGEDKTIRVWIKGEIDQTITLPAQSIWSVKLLPNNDIVCGASDGIVRIFSSNPERYASSEILQKFEEAVANSCINSEQEFGGMKINDLPDASALERPGKKDAETILIKQDGSVKAYSWSQKDLKWNLIGDVMGSNSSDSKKQLHNGIEYDFVFSVDIQDGIPPLKLPYNTGQDPWHVAQKFIDDNGLSQMYLEQVANFIVKNSTAAPILNTASQHHDPFTGGSRYVPSSATQNILRSNSGLVTDFSSNSNKCPYLPITDYLKLEQANLNLIREKLREFNLKEEVGTQRIPEDKLEFVVMLTTTMNHAAIEAEAIMTLTHLLNWPDSVIFPVLDIARLAVLQQNVNDKFCTDELMQLIARHLKKNALTTNQMLSFRIIANMFSHASGEQICLRHKSEILNYILDLPSFGNKNNQVAISTYILNLVVGLNKKNDSAGKTQILGVICNILKRFEEMEAVFRALVALGTLLIASSATERVEFSNIVRQSKCTLHIAKAAEDQDSKPRKKVLCVYQEILELIK